MKIQYISDIHLEYQSELPEIKQIGDILILAGDIGFPFSDIYKDFLIEINNKFKKVFLITGNHEFYNSEKNKEKTMEEIDDHIGNIITQYNLNNISYLDNSYEDYQGIRFYGTTLWTKISDPNFLTNDFTYIKDMSIDLRNELFENSCDSIDNLINESKLPIVVITHHVPSYKLIDPIFTSNRHKPYNQCYFTDCEKYFKEPIKAWIYGHTHKESNTEINGIKFLCNPKGYPNENLDVIDFNRVIEL